MHATGTDGVASDVWKCFRETLCDPDVAELLIARLLFWACDVQSPEGYRGELHRIFAMNELKFIALRQRFAGSCGHAVA